jgi:hypothetical protein
VVFSNRVPLCQATLSIGLYLLLEGPIPTEKLYPPRRGVINWIGSLSRSCQEPRGWLLKAFGAGPNGLAYPSWERTVQVASPDDV